MNLVHGVAATWGIYARAIRGGWKAIVVPGKSARIRRVVAAMAVESSRGAGYGGGAFHGNREVRPSILYSGDEAGDPVRIDARITAAFGGHRAHPRMVGVRGIVDVGPAYR